MREEKNGEEKEKEEAVKKNINKKKEHLRQRMKVWTYYRGEMLSVSKT